MILRGGGVMAAPMALKAPHVKRVEATRLTSKRAFMGFS
jgi:hypothetical protein